MSYQFDRWTITLGAQVCSLHDSLCSEDLEKLRKKAMVYEAELQQLYRYAEHHHINLMRYYHPFAEIEQRLLCIQAHLTREQVIAR